MLKFIMITANYVLTSEPGWMKGFYQRIAAIRFILPSMKLLYQELIGSTIWNTRAENVDTFVNFFNI